MTLATWKGRVLAGLLLLTGCLFAAAPADEKDKTTKSPKANQLLTTLKIAPSDQASLMAKAIKGSQTGMAGEVARDDEGLYRVVHIEFSSAEDRAAFKHDGVVVFNAIDRFADAFIKPQEEILQAIDRAVGENGWIDLGRPVQAPPPRPEEIQKERGRVLPDKIVRGGEGGLTGKGVIIAIIDSGIDFANPDFITYGEDSKPTSRILAFWDTFSDAYANGVGSRAPVTYPNGKSIGTVYSQEDLTAELRSAKPRIPSWDMNGHGTACAGIAAGNGNNASGKPDEKPLGVAPDADLIAVRIGEGPSLRIDNTYLLGAICAWIDAKAKELNKPVIISCSFGGHLGGHDGFGVLERQIDTRFPLEVKGRALCVAAGNEGSVPLHADVPFQGEEAKGRLKWNTLGTALLTLYFDLDTPEDFKKVHFDGVDQDKIKVRHFFHRLSKTVVSEFLLPPGQGELTLFHDEGKKGRVDAYLVSPELAIFHPSCAKFGQQINTPGTMANAITVGSYDWNDKFHYNGEWRAVPVDDRRGRPAELKVGMLSSYSNPGPNRKTRLVKPDLVAPGQWFAASYSRNTKPFIAQDSSAHYQLFSGTSAATPYTAGVIALLMQKNPAISLGRIKSLLQNHATRDDDFTGTVPNPEWGYGKLDHKAVTRLIEAVQ